MRILHLDSGGEMRGGQWQVLYLLRGLSERGHDVKLLARDDGPLLGRALDEGFDAEPVALAKVTRYRRWAKLIHAHDARSHTLAALAGGVPLIVSRRVAFPVRTGLVSRWKYRRAAHYIAISRFVAEKLLDAGIKSKSISVVYDGVPVDISVPLAGGATGQGSVLAPATADPMKGSDLVREAADVAGVEIVFSSDLRRDLARSRVFVYVTRSEGLGSAVLLAMAHGVAVVATRIGGLVEVIEDGRSGLLVENTAADIGRAIRLLLDDTELRERVGRAGRERVEHLFSLDTMVENTIRVYEKVRA